MVISVDLISEVTLVQHGFCPEPPTALTSRASRPGMGECIKFIVCKNRIKYRTDVAISAEVGRKGSFSLEDMWV